MQPTDSATPAATLQVLVPYWPFCTCTRTTSSLAARKLLRLPNWLADSETAVVLTKQARATLFPS